MQGCDRYIELGTSRITQGQKLFSAAINRKSLQSEVSADAVIDMHDRRTHVQFCEIADNLFRIDNSLTAIASFATGPCAQHIGFTDDHTVG